ncbi:di-trans,poly-cis-decaprenylcistransferase [Oscillospiraceae bacterium OttesenSCG-928-G22]|nr:di-trans,poly-cis-decaprenylcistransferase [Oscillospiraceae bacterium OttesenSCG-928-G22]
MATFQKSPLVDYDRLPKHIAIILDGNGRWAKQHGLLRKAGHAFGAENFRKVATYCRDIGIKYLTVYAFSTENWKRPPDEVSSILDLLRKYLKEAISQMERDRVRIHIMGDLRKFSAEEKALFADVNRISKEIDGCQLNICLNYGGRAEIVRAAQELASLVQLQEISPLEITESLFESALYSAGIPDPELLIRPGGELRLSNFLLWQLAYSELYFTDTFWPDFGIDELNLAIADYQSRERRFGGV